MPIPLFPSPRPWIVLALALAGLHMVLFDRGLGGDGWAPFAALESLADDGDLALENNVRGPRNGLVPTAGGHLAMQYPPGILLLDALPFAAGRALDALLPESVLAGGADLPPAGKVPRGVFLSAACIVLARNLAVLVGLLALAAALLRLGCGEKTVAASAALTFFGGPLVFYSLVGMTHAPAFALAALLLWALVRAREAASPRWWAFAGFLAGFATLVRLGSVALLVPALWVAWTSRQGEEAATAPSAPALSRLRRLVPLGIGFALPLAVYPLWLRLNFGDAPSGYGGEWRLTFASPWNVLLSPRHGAFLFHPALALAAIGLVRLALREGRALPWARPPAERSRDRASPTPQAREVVSGAALPGPVGSPLAGFGLAPLLWLLAVATLHGWWSEWANEGGYGQRFVTDALPALGAGFAALLAGRRFRSVNVAAALAATLFGYALFLASVGGLVPPPAGLPWPQRLAEYEILLREPPAPGELGDALRRSSFLLRGLLGPPSEGAESE